MPAPGSLLRVPAARVVTFYVFRRPFVSDKRVGEGRGILPRRAAPVNRMGIVRTMIDELRYWLARRCARHYAKPYLESVRKQDLQWTLELIDEDIELYGDPVVHQLAKVGCVDYAGNR